MPTINFLDTYECFPETQTKRNGKKIETCAWIWQYATMDIETASLAILHQLSEMMSQGKKECEYVYSDDEHE